MQDKNIKQTSRGVIKFADMILPPAVREVLAYLRNHGTLQFFGKTFTGVFANFEDVVRSFRGVVSYNSTESECEEIAHAVSSRAAVQDARRGIAPEPADRYTLLCALVGTLPHEAPVVLDVGGGTGEAFAHLIYSCPHKKPRLIVQELPPIAETGRAAFAGDAAISFVDRIEDMTLSVNAVFMGSSIQYFEDYKSFLSQVAALGPRMIVIAHTPMTDAPTFVTAQVNMRRRVIPNKIINRAELTAHMETLGFTLIHRSGSKTAAHFRNFPVPQRTSAFTNMVFASMT